MNSPDVVEARSTFLCSLGKFLMEIANQVFPALIICGGISLYQNGYRVGSVFLNLMGVVGVALGLTYFKRNVAGRDRDSKGEQR